MPPTIHILSSSLASRLQRTVVSPLQTWHDTLKPAVLAILSSSSFNVHPNTLYKMVESSVIQGPEISSSLFNLLQDLLFQHIHDVFSTLPPSPTYTSFLSSFNSIWTNLSSSLSLIIDIFTILDRSYVLRTLNTSIWSICYRSIQQTLESVTISISVSSNSIVEHLCVALADVVSVKRKGGLVQSDYQSNLIGLLLSINKYHLLEQKILSDAENFYLNYGSDTINSMPTISYLKTVLNCVSSENENFSPILLPSTLSKLENTVVQNLFSLHSDKLVEAGLREFLPSASTENLSILAKLLIQSNLIEKGQVYFRNLILSTGTQMVSSVKTNKISHSQFLEELLSFYSSCQKSVDQSFKGSETFKSIFIDSFEDFINESPSLLAMLLARHLDTLLRSPNTVSEFDVKLSQMITLFRLLAAKDVFAQYHRQFLAQRLLLSSISEDAEKQVIECLKAECGLSFTSGFQSMFTDINISREISDSFVSKQSLSFDFSVSVCSTANWPTWTTEKVQSPAIVDDLWTSFLHHYSSIHPSRRLEIVPSMSSMVLLTHIPKADRSGYINHELLVSQLQASVLLQFDRVRAISFTELQESTQMNTDLLKTVLKSLIQPKCAILLKKPSTPEVSASDAFITNLKFSSKFFRVKLQNIDQSESQDSTQDSHVEKRISIERDHLVDATIVRIMKTKRRLEVKELVEAVLTSVCSLGVDLESKFVKKRIDALIDRDYMVRDDLEPNVFNYVA
ncbi:hypothetical protein RCL1_008553 [Eukaryota sp. TZLM3-RCL]